MYGLDGELFLSIRFADLERTGVTPLPSFQRSIPDGLLSRVVRERKGDDRYRSIDEESWTCAATELQIARRKR